MILLAIIIDIFLILISLKYAWWYPSINTNKTRIMMYHMISNQIIGSKKSGLRVSEEMFEKHLRYFVKNNWKFIKMSDLNKYADDEKVVAITFDDGYLDNYKTAFPLLKKSLSILDGHNIEINLNTKFLTSQMCDETIKFYKEISL